MPNNLNEHVRAILSWHGQESGGVRVPFSERSGNPLRRSLETEVLRKVRDLAVAQATSGCTAPRWVFLVGGPGNGKSEAVEAYLLALDESLHASGRLVNQLKAAYSPEEITRKATVTDELVPELGTIAKRLVIVQDATSAEAAFANAARALVEDVEELLRTGDETLYLCCANRGIIARAISLARRSAAQNPAVLGLLVKIARVTSIGDDSLKDPPASWPIDGEQHVAAWPLDVESIVAPGRAGQEIISSAVARDQWEVNGACADCDSRELCPFRNNAEELRDTSRQAAVLQLLRHAELGSGQRWSFRDMFSLAADIIVGQRSDFHPYAHPCKWVHHQVESVNEAVDPDDEVRPLLNLIERHHAQALFPSWPIQTASRKLQRDSGRQPTSKAVAGWFANRKVDTSKHIRELLVDEGMRLLDPADASPADSNHVLIVAENAFSQSISFALTRPELPMDRLERKVLEVLARAEAEWESQQRDSAKSNEARQFMVTVSSVIVKRSIVARTADHPHKPTLDAYAQALRDRTRLNDFKTKLGRLLWDREFRASLTATFAQPVGRREEIVQLVGRKPHLRVLPAPEKTASRAGHDLPVIVMDEHVMPVTYELFNSINRAAQGCTEASMPAAVRASLDRLRTSHLGVASRDVHAFVRDEAHLELGRTGRVVLREHETTPVFVPSAPEEAE